MDSGFRRKDGFWTFDGFIKFSVHKDGSQYFQDILDPGFCRGDLNKLVLQLAHPLTNPACERHGKKTDAFVDKLVVPDIHSTDELVTRLQQMTDIYIAVIAAIHDNHHILRLHPVCDH
jgi:hypothetical protein